MGVATWTVSCGRVGPAIAAPTGLTLGDGGMAKPNLGVRAPPGRPPSAGRSGAGDDIMAMGADVGGVPMIGAAAIASRGALDRHRVSIFPMMIRRIRPCPTPVLFLRAGYCGGFSDKGDSDERGSLAG